MEIKLTHNLVVLIDEMYELGIDPVFWEIKGLNALLSQHLARGLSPVPKFHLHQSPKKRCVKFDQEAV